MLNKVVLIGRLGTDPDLRYSVEGRPIARFRLAVTTRFPQGPGDELREETEWFTVVVSGRQAEVCAQSLRKGDRVFVEGRLRSRSWRGQDGLPRFELQALARRVLLLSPGRSEEATSPGGEIATSPEVQEEAFFEEEP